MTAGKGVHRYDFDGRYAYISPTAEGYVGNIMMILDLADPAKPKEVGRWWIPGQWQAGGEAYPWGDGVTPRCHHPLRMGDRLYVSYWHHGLFILDISDMAKPKAIAHLNSSPTFPHPTHTCLRIPQKLKGRNIMVVADEDVAKLRPHRLPSPGSTTSRWRRSRSRSRPSRSRPRQGRLAAAGDDRLPSAVRALQGTVIPFAWFAQGLRLVDIADPFAPKEVGSFLPDTPSGADRASSNDVTIDDRGLIYLVDRIRGVDIIETNVMN